MIWLILQNFSKHLISGFLTSRSPCQLPPTTAIFQCDQDLQRLPELWIDELFSTLVLADCKNKEICQPYPSIKITFKADLKNYLEYH